MMQSKFLLSIAVLFCVSVTGLKVEAQNIISELETPKAGEGTVHIVCDPKIMELLGTPVSSSRSSEAVPVSEDENSAARAVGYRIQIYMDNSQKAKTEVVRIENMFKETFSDVAIYVRYTAPNWRVVVGDFRTKEEADIFKQNIQNSLPELGKEMYVISSKINLPVQK